MHRYREEYLRMATGVQPINTPARLEISVDPFHLHPRKLAHARQLQREGRTMTEIASELGLGRAVVVENLYWRLAFPEVAR